LSLTKLNGHAVRLVSRAASAGRAGEGAERSSEPRKGTHRAWGMWEGGEPHAGPMGVLQIATHHEGVRTCSPVRVAPTRFFPTRSPSSAAAPSRHSPSMPMASRSHRLRLRHPPTSPVPAPPHPPYVVPVNLLSLADALAPGEVVPHRWPHPLAPDAPLLLLLNAGVGANGGWGRCPLPCTSSSSHGRCCGRRGAEAALRGWTPLLEAGSVGSGSVGC
jgi:hypothetical protein